MPPAPSTDDIADAIFRGAIDGYFPDTEELATAELTAQHLPIILKTLHDAKDAVKEEVRRISRENATPVDSWIQQARRLHEDIEVTKVKAEEILKLAEEEKALEAQLEDAETQAKFLQGEIRFNEELASILGRLQLIGATLTQADVAIQRGEFEPAVAVLDGADDALSRLAHTGFEGIVVVGLLKEKAKQLRSGLKQRLEDAWGMLMKMDEKNASISLAHTVDLDGIEVESDDVILTLETLGLLNAKLDNFHQQLNKILIVPRLETQEGRIPRVEVEGDTIREVGQDNDLSAARLFSDLRMIIKFLDDHLPAKVMTHLQTILVPTLTTRLIATRLSSAVPERLEDFSTFEDLLKETERFEEELQKSGWTTERKLRDWVESAPKVWLEKRRVSSLDAARKILAQGISNTEIVERSETQTITADDHDGQRAVVAGVAEATGADDIDWGDNWGVDEDENENENDNENQEDSKPKPPPKAEEPGGFLQDEDEDDGANGWNLDDDDLGLDEEPAPEPAPEPETKPSEPQKEEGDEDDWGAWGVDEEEEDEADNTKDPVPAAEPTAGSTSSSKPTARNRRQSTTSKAVTLTETYTITSIPPQLLDLITALLTESYTLSTSPTYHSSPISAAAPGIRSLPTQILAIYRALAPLYYTHGADLRGAMFLYNDTLRLIDQLPHIKISSTTSASSSASSASSSPSPDIEPWEPTPKDLAQLTTFSKRVYTREMDSQRTILLDFLDSAQGFVACTDYPQSTECESAIITTIARLREIHVAWETALSKSALYQSIGSLVNTVVTKLVNDILDLSDISEPESVQLAKFLEQMAEQFEPLFTTAAAAQQSQRPDKRASMGPEGGEQGKSRVVLYCANWLRFRFLEQVLRGSLADITYLWKEGILGQDFELDEVVELVKALFADTEHRRKALDEIRNARW